MLRYILKRLLFFLPTLVIISLMAFMISLQAPVDPVEKACPSIADGVDLSYAKECLEKNRKKFRLHLPVFYGAFTSWSTPKAIYKTYDPAIKKTLERLIHEFGNWESVNAYHQAVQNSYEAQQSMALPSGQKNREALVLAKERVFQLLFAGKPVDIDTYLYSLDTLLSRHEVLIPMRANHETVKSAYSTLKSTATPWKSYIPKVVIYGTDNQYHHWITNILFRFDFGVDYNTGLPITQRISDMLFWSFLFALLSVIIAYGIGVPLGILTAVYRDTWLDRGAAIAVFALDAMPNFWVATLLLMTFANPDALNWFPSRFSTYNASLGDMAHQMILPLIAYTYGSFAFLSRTMRISLLETLQQDYIRTASAKGLPYVRVILTHALKNALLPIITVFVTIFPALIGGSVILENIFTIPGMGNEIWKATLENNTPMILAVFTLSGFLTVLGYLVADVLYAWADPRIRFDTE